jgi:Rrf2 family protein
MSLDISIFSASTKHAIQAMIYLATYQKDPVLVSTIAKYYNLPGHYLAKIIQILVKNNLIVSTRGRGGGILIKKKLSSIKILDIVHAIEGKKLGKEMCVYRLDRCSDSIPCPVHKHWKKIKPKIQDEIINQTLDALSKELLNKHDILNKLYS